MSADERDQAEFEAGLRCCWDILARLSDVDGIGEPDLGEGKCDDCKREVAVRWTHGRFELCRSCRRLRHRVSVRLEAMRREEEAAKMDWAAS